MGKATATPYTSRSAVFDNVNSWTPSLDTTYFECCHVSAVAAADPRHHFGSGCIEQRRRDDHRLDDGYWTIWFHAAEPHGLGRADPSLSIDDDNCRITGAWLGSRKFEKMACGWSTGALCPSSRGSLFTRCIRINGGARNCPSGYYVPFCLARS